MCKYHIAIVYKIGEWKKIFFPPFMMWDFGFAWIIYEITITSLHVFFIRGKRTDFYNLFTICQIFFLKKFFCVLTNQIFDEDLYRAKNCTFKKRWRWSSEISQLTEIEAAGKVDWSSISFLFQNNCSFG